MNPPNPNGCNGFMSTHRITLGLSGWTCGYHSDIDCDDCRYGKQGGRKDPEVWHDLVTKKAKKKGSHV